LPEARTAADVFRELLAMPPSERAAAMASKSEHQRAYLDQKVREYGELPPAEREARLTQLEFRSHLLLLMNTAPGNRAHRLGLVPAHMRLQIEQRLAQWDLLPIEVQKKALDHEVSVNYLLRGRPQQETTAAPPLPVVPAANLQKLQALSPEQRRKVGANVSQFFALPANARQNALDNFSAEERREMEKTLKDFEKLSPEQRQICIASFEKLSSMSKEERAQFLKNAERWRAMSPRERDVWRDLVSIIPPASAMPPMPSADTPSLGHQPAQQPPAFPTPPPGR
jgi:hypothetical protein